MMRPDQKSRSGAAGLLRRVFLAAAIALLFQGLAPAPGRALQGHLNLNQATMTELQTLPFIGEARARAIIAYRRQHGPFPSLDKLLESKAIGPSTLEAIRPYLTLTEPTTIAETAPPPAARPGAATLSRYSNLSLSPDGVRLLPDAAYFDNLLAFIRTAQHRIDICMFLFKTTNSRRNRAAKVLRELIRARKRGVLVNVLLENSGYDDKLNRENRRIGRLLKKNRVMVRFDTPETTTHAKLVVIDRRFSFVGSHNLTQSALAFNHEFSLLIDSRPLALELINYMGTIH